MKIHQTELVEAIYLREIPKGFGDKGHGPLCLYYQRSNGPLVLAGKEGKMSLGLDDVGVVAADLKGELKAKDKFTNFLCVSFSEKCMADAISDNKLNREDTKRLRNGFFEKLEPTPWLKSLLKQYYYEVFLMKDSPPGCTFFIEKQMINEVLRCLFTNYHLKNDDSLMRVDITIYEALRFIDSRFQDENFSIAQVSREVGMSDSSLLRRFKSSIGQTPQEYLKDKRLQTARQLLSEQNLSVSDVCFMVGYSDFSSFSKSFKAKFGVLPSEAKQLIV